MAPVRSAVKRPRQPGAAALTPAGVAEPPRLPLDSSLFFKLVRVVNLTARPFVETLSRSHQLSLNEWRVMVVLASHPGVAAREVADSTGLDKMSISRAIAVLHRRGRLVKQADAADARRTRLWLSDTGHSLFTAIGTLATGREAQLFSGISTAEQALVGEMMDRLIAALQRSEPEQA
jgi:DNA-binding MarR family transcriptional regulator